MRISNVWGAVMALFISLGMWYGFYGTLTGFIDSSFTGEMHTLALIALFIIAIFTIVGMPILIAIKDDDGGA